jgi:hypothetical protein
MINLPVGVGNRGRRHKPAWNGMRQSLLAFACFDALAYEGRVDKPDRRGLPDPRSDICDSPETNIGDTSTNFIVLQGNEEFRTHCPTLESGKRLHRQGWHGRPSGAAARLVDPQEMKICIENVWPRVSVCGSSGGDQPREGAPLAFELSVNFCQLPPKKHRNT